MRTKSLSKVLVIVGALALIFAVPRSFNYQGKLIDASGVGVNDTLPLTFRLYTSESGGEPIWEQTISDVIIRQGLFSVELSGFPDSVDFSEQYWLEVVVEGEAMRPREKLVSAPYSIRAGTAERGYNPIYSEANSTRRRGEFVFRAGEGATLTDDGGTINITLSSPGGVPDLVSVLAAGNDAGNRFIKGLHDPVDNQDAATKHYVDNYVPSLDRVLAAGNDAGGRTITNLGEPSSDYDAATKLYVDSHSGSGLTGSGTSGAVARWTGGTSLGTGSIYDNGSSVGIGTSSPSATLDVNGTGRFNGTLDVSGNRITNVATPTASSDAATKAYVDAAGGGGAMYWEITVTSNTYNGNLGGYAGANQKCKNEFGSTSFMLNYSIFANAYMGGIPLIINISQNPVSSFPQGAWFGSARAGAVVATGNTSTYEYYYPVFPRQFWGYYTSSYSEVGSDCRGWTSSSSSDYGNVITGDGGWRAGQTCNTARPIVCATLKFITP